MKPIQKILQAARHKKGLTQRQMAELLGITTRSYQRYEYGDRKMSLDTAIKVSELLGIDVHDLAGRNFTSKSDETETA